VTLPGRKQVHRFAAHDVLGGRDEPVAGGRPLLEPALAGGRRVRPRASITEARDRRAAAVAALPSRLRMLSGREAPYDVRVSDGLQGLSAELIERHRG
jgi:nicotinate phosphoribosyltransferase